MKDYMLGLLLIMPEVVLVVILSKQLESSSLVVPLLRFIFGSATWSQFIHYNIYNR